MLAEIKCCHRLGDEYSRSRKAEIGANQKRLRDTHFAERLRDNENNYSKYTIPTEQSEKYHCWEFRELSLLGVQRVVTAGSVDRCLCWYCRELSLLGVQRVVTAGSVESCHR